ncbi:MAG: LysR family transcriptional regulator [Phormidesmis priestleyi]|uniref:LysR family transcriptional regulator n=1 Tax=Phormidesmis priestleyi TaxID=268141 RepID=A0A2W4XTN7_9CYAN|nr:MAG: LysR family transcriptional regulator [Phormidesmis priestleyi]
MDKLESMRAFTEVVNHGGFAAAGRQMGLSRSVVNKLVAQLEADLDVQLLQRTTRMVSPTDMGRAYYSRCVDILAEVAAADVAVSQLRDQPKGSLRINAPMSFGTLHLAEALAHFMTQYPDIQVQLTLSDRFIDLIEEGFDVTLRIAETIDETLVTKTLAPIHRVICASPSYLEKHGTPVHPNELSQHDCLKYGQIATNSQWQLKDSQGKLLNVKLRCKGYSNNGEVLKAQALAGVGITLLPTFILGEALKTGQLITILPDYRPSSLCAYLGYATNRHLSTKVRLLSAFLQDWFKQPTSWES